MKTRLSSCKGITLIELLSAVVIIGIVASMAVPRFQKAYERMKFRSNSRDIVSTLRLARSMSISDKGFYGVYFDPDTRMVTLFTKDSLGTGYEAGVDSVVRVDTLPSQFSYLGTDITQNTVMFKPNGAASFSGGGNIVTMASTDDVVGIYQVNILPSTGRVKGQGYYY